jgi:type II secretory pathway component PulM
MNLIGWWQDRNQREQLVLVGGVVILLIAATYLVVDPIIQERAEMSDAIPGLRADLAWMQAHSDEMKDLLENTRKSSISDRPPLTLSVVQAILRDTGLLDDIEDLSGTTQSGISLNITDVAFSDLVQFLYMIRLRSQGNVKTAEITRSDNEPGIVTANIVLSSVGQ